MLAYVFWHWPGPQIDTAAYEDLQRAFHRALAQAAPSGFRHSVVFRVDGSAPWLGGAPAYADWYLLDSSAALDPLNVAAVSGACQEPHERVARAAAAGVGSLLALHAQQNTGHGEQTSLHDEQTNGYSEQTAVPGEQPTVSAARQSTWLAKPKGMPYADFYAALEAVPGSLWRRQMVLGPTPEFGILSADPVTIPPAFQALALKLLPLIS